MCFKDAVIILAASLSLPLSLWRDCLRMGHEKDMIRLR